MLFERGRWSRAMIGFRLERHSGPSAPGGRSSHGIGAAAGSPSGSAPRSRALRGDEVARVDLDERADRLRRPSPARAGPVDQRALS